MKVVITPTSCIYHMLDGDLERLDPGTTVYINENGEFHRKDGPAVIRLNGWEEWWLNGKMHRSDGPAAYSEDKYDIQWRLYGKVHRIDGPAIINGKHQTWCYQGVALIDSEHGLVQIPYHNLDLPKLKELQEFIIKFRPDFIGQIPDLDPELKEKYAHELALSGMDI